jgi:hypothetical protein
MIQENMLVEIHGLGYELGGAHRLNGKVVTAVKRDKRYNCDCDVWQIEPKLEYQTDAHTTLLNGVRVRQFDFARIDGVPEKFLRPA